MTIERPNQVHLGQGVYAFVNPRLGFGYSNIGLVIDHDGLTVIDTSATPAQAALTAQAIIELTADLELPIKRVILTSSRIAFSGGGQRFWSAAFYGTEVTSEQLDAPANPLAFRRLLPEFANVYSDEFTTRPITHTVSEPVQLTPAIMAIPLVGESAGNLALYVESCNVVFAGALASFRVTPLAFDGYPRTWIESLGQLAEIGATVIPGHGPPGGSVDLAELAAYLEACDEANPEAGLGRGPWNDWSDRRFDAINIERAQALSRGVDQVPQAMLTLLGF